MNILKLIGANPLSSFFHYTIKVLRIIFPRSGLEKLALPTEVGSSLCGQDCPWGFVIEGAFPDGDTHTAQPAMDVVVHTSFDDDVWIVRVEPRDGAYVVTGRAQADAAPEPVGPSPAPDRSIEVSRVRVTGDHITFTGRVRPAIPQCVQTQLLADGEPEAWWPADACANNDEGRWTMAVPLGVDRAPEAPDPAVQYVLRARLRDEPAVLTEFWFDLAPPPAP